VTIPTEPIGSIPRPPELIAAVAKLGNDHPSLEALDAQAVRDTLLEFERTGSPVVSDGEQRKYHNFWTYSVHGLAQYRPGRLRDPSTFIDAAL
jgi:5-methyltetrahydropteroyltriglutamate--homocysteine methyltransferase